MVHEEEAPQAPVEEHPQDEVAHTGEGATEAPAEPPVEPAHVEEGPSSAPEAVEPAEGSERQPPEEEEAAAPALEDLVRPSSAAPSTSDTSQQADGDAAQRPSTGGGSAANPASGETSFSDAGESSHLHVLCILGARERTKMLRVSAHLLIPLLVAGTPPMAAGLISLLDIPPGAPSDNDGRGAGLSCRRIPAGCGRHLWRLPWGQG